MGRPAINTVFIPSPMKDAFNQANPINDQTLFRDAFTATARALGNSRRSRELPGGLPPARHHVDQHVQRRWVPERPPAAGRRDRHRAEPDLERRDHERLRRQRLDVPDDVPVLGRARTSVTPSSLRLMMQKRRPRTALRFSDDECPPRSSLLVFILAFAALLFFRWREQPADVGRPPEPRRSSTTTLLGVSRLDTDKGIAQFETRVKEDPRDFISLTDPRSAVQPARPRQERSRRFRARRAGIPTGAAAQSRARRRQVGAGGRLRVAAQVFGGARSRARAVRDESRTASTRSRRMTDALLETGQYKEGEEALGKLTEKIGEMPAILARRAQLAELKGQTGPAVTLLQRAVESMRRDGRSRAGDRVVRGAPWRRLLPHRLPRRVGAALRRGAVALQHVSARPRRSRRHPGRAGTA